MAHPEGSLHETIHSFLTQLGISWDEWRTQFLETDVDLEIF